MDGNKTVGLICTLCGLPLAVHEKRDFDFSRSFCYIKKHMIDTPILIKKFCSEDEVTDLILDGVELEAKLKKKIKK